MYLYDNVLVEDINNLFTNSTVKAVLADTLDDAIKRTAAESKDKVELPFIALSGGDWSLDDANFYNYMRGSEFKRVENENFAKATNVIPFTPSYNMYIVAISTRECDMLTREILFHYYTYPTLTVKVPYGIDELHTFNVNFDKMVRKSQHYSGLVYRTLSINLSGAYLWHNNTMEVVKDVNVKTEERYENNV